MTFTQDIVVTLIMFGALALVLRRVVGFARTKSSAPKCAACDSGACAPAVAPSSPIPDQSGSKPLVFIRSAR